MLALLKYIKQTAISNHFVNFLAKGVLLRSELKYRVSQSDMFFSEMALRGRKVENFDDIFLAAWSRGLPICVSSTSFQKNSIGWPQQPPTERISDISEKLDF